MQLMLHKKSNYTMQCCVLKSNVIFLFKIHSCPIYYNIFRAKSMARILSKDSPFVDAFQGGLTATRLADEQRVKVSVKSRLRARSPGKGTLVWSGGNSWRHVVLALILVRPGLDSFQSLLLTIIFTRPFKY